MTSPIPPRDTTRVVLEQYGAPTAASDYLSQQLALAASKRPSLTFASCGRSLAPERPFRPVRIMYATIVLRRTARLR